jgi:hypothetical protein
MHRPATPACLVCLLASVTIAEQAKLDVVYSESQDRACAKVRGYDIKDEWVKELNEALPNFRDLWNTKGPAMFAAVTSLTHRSIDPYAQPVRLTLCDTPSQSFSSPSINMRFALHSFTTSPVPLRYKVDTAFHESLHGFIADYAPQNSELLASHRSESSCVLNHLHLLALQKAVLLAVGDLASLEQVVSIDSQLPSGCYKRAWSLINETDSTYKQYVAELARESKPLVAPSSRRLASPASGSG